MREHRWFVENVWKIELDDPKSRMFVIIKDVDKKVFVEVYGELDWRHPLTSCERFQFKDIYCFHTFLEHPKLKKCDGELTANGLSSDLKTRLCGVVVLPARFGATFLEQNLHAEAAASQQRRLCEPRLPAALDGGDLQTPRPWWGRATVSELY